DRSSSSRDAVAFDGLLSLSALHTSVATNHGSPLIMMIRTACDSNLKTEGVLLEAVSASVGWCMIAPLRDLRIIAGALLHAPAMAARRLRARAKPGGLLPLSGLVSVALPAIDLYGAGAKKPRIYRERMPLCTGALTLHPFRDELSVLPGKRLCNAPANTQTTCLVLPPPVGPPIHQVAQTP